MKLFTVVSLTSFIGSSSIKVNSSTCCICFIINHSQVHSLNIGNDFFYIASMFTPNGHTILFVMPSSKPTSRTYADFESLTEALEGGMFVSISDWLASEIIC